MPFSIKVKGQAHEPQEWTRPADVEEATQQLTHAGWLAWENYNVMADSRRRAIDLWERHERLGLEMDERGVEHPKYGSAYNRLCGFKDEIVVHQVRFLTSERTMDLCWKMMSRDERREDGIAEYIQQPASKRHVMGLWHWPFATGDVPDEAFHMGNTALLIATAQQRSIYLAQRLGRSEDE
ncbi:MAG: hypothetical protein H0W28_07555 [Pyrinomonadaceae bacterium]|nr:hypothetical protein [Pyrinomonadaceae bacterium]